MSKRSKTKTVGYGWVGKWRDGTLGWIMPRHVNGLSLRVPEYPADINFVSDEDQFTLCKITVEEVPGKRRQKMGEMRKRGRVRK